MKCPCCGAESSGKFCEYCGSEMPQEKSTVNVSHIYYGDAIAQEPSEAENNLGKCPKCGNSKITFKRERVGTKTQTRSRKNYIGSGRQSQSASQSSYRTIGLCQNCGYTWDPNATNQSSNTKAFLPKCSNQKTSGKKTWLWVLGWICFFPLPLTILLLRNKNMKHAVKYGIIAAAWILFFIIGMSGNGGTDSPQTGTPPSYNESVQGDQASETTDNNTSSTVSPDDGVLYPMQITSANYTGPECWLLSEPTTTNETVLNVYAAIDIQNENWHEQAKSVIALLWSKYSGERVMFKIYNGTEGFYKTQPTYEELIAIWQNAPLSVITDSTPTITWYPSGGGTAAQQETESWEPTLTQETVVYAEDEVVNRFIIEFNANSVYEITNISKGNIKTKYFGYANGRYLEMINANDAGAEAFCLKINGGQEASDKQMMYEVFREAVKILDPSITDEMIDTTLAEFDDRDVLIEDYTLGDSLIITYVPTKELSYGKNSCRIDIYASNYK